MGRHSLSILFAVLLGASSASSAEPPENSREVAFQDCESDPIGEAAFLRALVLELAVEPNKASNAPRPMIDVRFHCDGQAIIRIQDPNGAIERTVRFGDVAKRERARALALVVAELVHSSARNELQSQPATTTPSEPEGNPPARPNTEPNEAAAHPNEPKEPARPPVESKDVVSPPVEANPKRSGTVVFRAGATARATIGNSAKHFGADLGLDLPLFRVQAEALLARESRARGSITSGIAALSLGRDVRFAHAGPITATAGLSAAAGVTWAVGQSQVPGSIVRDVLMPYFDARFEITALWQLSSQLEPYLGVYAGRAAGIVALADGESTQSTGGWFVGMDIGSRF